MVTADSHRAQFQARYLLNEERFGIRRRSLDRLPVIDVAALLSPTSTPEARQAVAAEIREACINSGFFYITGYGIPDNHMYAIREMMIRFFNLPAELKEPARCLDLTAARGWCPMRSEKITPGYEPDYKEYYDFGQESDDTSLSPADRGVTRWPAESALPGFQAAMRAHVRSTLAVAQGIVRGFALALDLPENFFDEAHRVPFYNFRPSYYPPARDVLKANEWSCGPHTDYMSMTMLWQDDVGGLEVMNLDGNWIAAPPMPETMVLNIADMMSIWTNDLFTSNPHRVANRADRHRVSLAHFMGPGPSTQVQCLPTCQGEGNPARYEPTTTTQHVMNIMAKAMPPELAQSIKMENAAATEQLRAAHRIGAA